MTIFYPDVSSAQAGISFAGSAIAMVKATESTNYINPDYAPAKVRAASAGAYFCAYHFLHAGHGAGEASFAHGVVGSKVPLMIDVEPTYNGPAPYPAPTGLALSSVSVSVHWDVVTVNGQAVASYTVEAVGLNGHVYVRETPATNSVVLSGLTQGWTYNILVWANGGPVAPPHASLQVTV